MWQNSDKGFSDFRISGQSFIKENCHTQEPVKILTSNLDQQLNLTREKNSVKKIDIFPIYGQFGAIWKPDSGRLVCKTYIFINSNLLSYKNWKKKYRISNTALTLLPWITILFPPKNADFLQKKADTSRIKRALVLKGIFSETTYGRVLKY